MQIPTRPVSTTVSTDDSTRVSPTRVNSTRDVPQAADPGAGPQPWARTARLHGRMMRRMAREVLRLLGERPDEAEVDDLVQEVFCRLLETSCGFDPAGRDLKRQRAYLRRVTRSVAVDRRRAKAAEKRGGGVARVSLGFGDLREEGGDGEATAAVDGAPTPEQAVLSRERWQLFLRRCRRAAGGTPSSGRDAEAVALALVGGWTSRELAAASRDGLSPATIDSLICRVRRRLVASGLRLPRRGGAL